MDWLLVAAMAMAGFQLPGVICLLGNDKPEPAVMVFSSIWMGLLGAWIAFA